MSQRTQGTPAFRPGEASFVAPCGHTLDLHVGPDYLAAFLRLDGADMRQPLSATYGYTPARTALLNRVPVLVVAHTYLPLPVPEHAAAVAFLAAHGAYTRSEGIDA